MQPPFTADQFFDVFRRYNEAVWPAQVALNVIGVLAAAAAYRANARRSRTWARAAVVLLAGLWLWTGIVYFKMFFVAITPAAQVFGSFFIAEAALLLVCAWEIGPLEQASRSSLAVSGFILVYALLLYPIVGTVAGQQYPALPTFGAPCPVTIFTFGLLALLPSSVSRVAIAVPVLWVAISSGRGDRRDRRHAPGDAALARSAPRRLTATPARRGGRGDDGRPPAARGATFGTGSIAMRKTFIVTIIASVAFLLISCGSTEPGPVQVIGVPEDLVPITGEWIGTYDSSATGRSGSITFHLTENPKGAHGDVLMVPKHEFIRGNEEPRRHSEPLTEPSVLAIEFVRIAAGEISGKIAPYPDPEAPGATLETHFAGHLDGEWIEGTFVTYSDHGVSPRRGTWRVHRKSAV